MLKRFWFGFERFREPTPLNFGCGVTAFTYDDAVNLMNQEVFDGQGLPEIVRAIENVNPNELDRNHVLPNIGLILVRGIWWPQGWKHRGPISKPEESTTNPSSD
jgi:hypothetical protein